MRRLVIFTLLLLAFAGMFRLSRIAQEWHYIVPTTGDEALYATSFDGDLSEWGQDERGTFSHRISDGVLRVIANDDDIGPASLLAPYFEDFDLRVSSHTLNGDFAGGNNNAFGVVFRRTDEDNYYLFLISGDGYYRVQRAENGFLQELSTWNPSDAIQQGIGATNVLRVVGQGDEFRFYVNDALLELCIPTEPDATSTVNSVTGECVGGAWTTTLQDSAHRFGQIGVVVDADEADRVSDEPIIIDFDNVVITGVANSF